MILIKISRRQRIEFFLLGRFPQEITRDRTAVLSIVPASIYAGIPSQLLTNRPDIKQAN
jgi:outer membrane protein TolC